MWKQNRTTCDAISCGRRGRGNIFSNTGTRRVVCAFSYAAQEPTALTFATYCALAFQEEAERARADALAKARAEHARELELTVKAATRERETEREKFAAKSLEPGTLPRLDILMLMCACLSVASVTEIKHRARGIDMCCT